MVKFLTHAVAAAIGAIGALVVALVYVISEGGKAVSGR